jgi:hypothetical protein
MFGAQSSKYRFAHKYGVWANCEMAKSPNEFTIFYAWQSDTSANHNRHLIEESLQDACARLGAKDSIPFVITLTSDTKGVPGFCDIPAARDADKAAVCKVLAKHPAGMTQTAIRDDAAISARRWPTVLAAMVEAGELVAVDVITGNRITPLTGYRLNDGSLPK